ncbi:MAG: hypothetical protein KDD47_19905, partial [Acidobacteria bacterium]|nr:hypothetical protein [Acidobacteriota bacterium]
SLGGALTSTTAEEDEEIFLPATDCRDTSLHLELTETLGPFQLSQNASWERQENLLDPFLDSTTTSAGLSAQGTFRRGGLALSLSGTRVAGDASLGVTESLTASLQPSWRLEGLHVSLVPYLSYSETRNDLLLIEDVTEQGQLTLGWDPPWARSLLSLQVSGGWSRSYDRIAEARPDFEAVYRASVTIRWGLERPSGEGVQ